MRLTLLDYLLVLLSPTTSPSRRHVPMVYRQTTFSAPALSQIIAFSPYTLASYATSLPA